MAEKIVYLVTSGEYADMTPEAVFTDAALAHQFKSQVEEGHVRPFPALDYIPTKVMEYSVHIKKRFDRWEVDEEITHTQMVWDFQAPVMAPRVTFGHMTIWVAHREESVARDHARMILAELQPDA